MVKRVSGTDRVKAALQDAADALKTDGKTNETTRSLRSSSRHTSRNTTANNSNANSNANSCNQSPTQNAKGVSSPAGTLAVPRLPSKKPKAYHGVKTTVVDPTTRERFTAERDAALAGGENPDKEQLANEIAAREKAGDVTAAKASSSRASRRGRLPQVPECSLAISLSPSTVPPPMVRPE